MWPVNLLRPSTNDAFDTTSLFMMQLACIVNMVPQWRKLKLRLRVCDLEDGSDVSNLGSSNYDKLENLLKLLRISAELYPVYGLSDILKSQRHDVDGYLKRFV